MSQDSGIDYPLEFKDVYKVLDHGAKKYGANSWLSGKHFNHKDNTASMFRHLAEAHNHKVADEETGLDPLLHLACRALMAYTIKRRKDSDADTSTKFVRNCS